MGIQGMCLYKWYDIKGSNGGLGFNIIVFCYVDVFLMVVEVMNELSYGDELVLEYLNKVCVCSYVKIYIYFELDLQEKFCDVLVLECCFELVFENYCWFDLVCIGKVLEMVNVNNGGFVLKVDVKQYQFLFLIF